MSHFAALMRASPVRRRLRRRSLGLGTVELTLEDECILSQSTIQYPEAAIEARVKNTDALALHRARSFAKAASGFRDALAIGPGFTLARMNLVAALAMAGALSQAIAAASPLIGSNNTWCLSLLSSFLRRVRHVECSASACTTRYDPPMEKFATPDEVLAQIRRMSVDDREYIEAELMRDAYESGRITEPPAILDEIVRRANETLANPDQGLSREEAVAKARLAAQESRRRRS